MAKQFIIELISFSKSKVRTSSQLELTLLGSNREQDSRILHLDNTISNHETNREQSLNRAAYGHMVNGINSRDNIFYIIYRRLLERPIAMRSDPRAVFGSANKIAI